MKRKAYEMMRRVEDSHWWFVGRRSIIADIVRCLKLPKSSELLEIGCGTGGNIHMLTRFGNLTCVEHDHEAAAIAQERSSVEVLQGSLPDRLPKFSKKFDLVLALDVLEHVENDQASIMAMAEQLNATGTLLITVPAFPFLWSQHDEDSQHFRRYRIRDLRRLAEPAELKLAYVSYFNFWLFPAIAVVRVLSRLAGVRAALRDMRPPSSLLNRLLTIVFSSERYLLGRLSLPFGVSALAVYVRLEEGSTARS